MMKNLFLEFEQPVYELEGKIAELYHLSNKGDDLNIAEEVSRLQKKVDRLLQQIYSKLTPWQKVQVARHSERPQFLTYLERLITGFIPLAGDRLFAEDRAIIGGIGRFKNRPILVIGQHKGKDIESRLKHNFGMAKPEGYRKAKRLMELADRFRLPVLTFIDTAGAYPGIEAEERGQAEAIARCIEASLKVQVPLISVVIGEGGSGGAIAIATANKVLMLEHSIYSVISPEGCASILWRSATKAPEAAAAQRLTAQDLLKLGVIDQIISEPVGGAHRYPEKVITAVGESIEQALNTLVTNKGSDLVRSRREKFMKMGARSLFSQ